MQEVYENVRDGLALFGALVVICGSLVFLFVATRKPDDYLP